MPHLETIAAGPGQWVKKETLKAKRGVRPDMTIYHPLKDEGELPRLRLPGITERKEAFEDFSIKSALGGVACAAMDQPYSWTVMTPGGAKRLRTESAVNGIHSVNDYFDNRGVVPIAHSLGGVDMAHAGQDIGPDVTPVVFMENVAGLRDISLPEFWLDAEIGALTETFHMGLSGGARHMGRLALCPKPQLSAEGLYASMARTEDLIRNMGRKGIKVAFLWSKNDQLIPCNSNRLIDEENITATTLVDANGKSCHNVSSCNPELSLSRINLLTETYKQEGVALAKPKLQNVSHIAKQARPTRKRSA